MAIRLFIMCVMCAAVSFAAPVVERSQDYDGDGQDDIGVFHGDGNAWYIRNSANASLRSVSTSVNGRPVLGDFDGDGRADPGVYEQQTGAWSIQLSGGGTRSLTLGGKLYRPVARDYDGDGRTDPAVYRRDTGEWRILLSSTGQTSVRSFGFSEARPVPADYDGDGRADLALFVRSTATWYILNSGNSAQRVFNFGWRDVRPVVADYDGDRRADVAVYHPDTGNWYIQQSGASGAVRIVPWGFKQARPVPGDYDGDGRADVAVYHRASGQWYISKSGANGQLFQVAWGWKNASPLPSYRDGGIMGLIALSFGDSITYGTSSLTDGPDTGYPQLLEYKTVRNLGGHHMSINAGNPGESTADGVLRIGIWLSYTRPDLTIIMEGTNDEFFKVPFSQTKNNLASMVLQAQSAGSTVILGTIPPVIKSAYRDRTAQEKLIEQFNPNIYDIAKLTGAYVAPVWETITAQPNWQSTLMDQETANHPNDAGYRVVRDAFYNVIEQLVIDGKIY